MFRNDDVETDYREPNGSIKYHSLHIKRTRVKPHVLINKQQSLFVINDLLIYLRVNWYQLKNYIGKDMLFCHTYNWFNFFVSVVMFIIEN